MSASPVFVAVFSDNETVRMSCWHGKGRASLDLHRGLKLARAAYVARMHNRAHSTNLLAEAVIVPAIVKAHFEDTESEPAAVLAKYDEREIREAGLKRAESTTKTAA
jgi:hypothetical protein